MPPLDTILKGDVLEQLRALPDECVDCIITSPPYYSLRDYGVEGQLGLEPTLAEFLNRMLLITAELKRVLKKTGTMWWNHGDNYSHKQAMGNQGKNGGRADRRFTPSGIPGRVDTPEKSLTLQAHRLAIRMVDEQGWILRNQIIWHKPNVMPSSIRDRFTVDYEPIFMFAKSKRYFFETQRQRTGKEYSWEEYGARLGKDWQNGKNRKETDLAEGMLNMKKRDGGRSHPEGRNMRTVWKIATKSFKEAHFATFPEALIETPIRAGCPEFVCIKCGKPREKMIKNGERILGSHSRKAVGKYGEASEREGGKMYYRGHGALIPNARYEKIVEGYTDCGCGAGWQGGVCLDPFMGAGTTAVVARKLGRHYLGIELNPEYIRIAEKRLNDVQLTLL